MLFASTDRPLQIPQAALTEPNYLDRLKDEMDLLGFTVSGHPLDLIPSIQWERYCPIAKLGEHFGERVKVCGLTFADRIAPPTGRSKTSRPKLGRSNLCPSNKAA
jgi:hypothetical protein